MGNAVITSASAGLGASGMNDIMTILADQFLKVKRTRGHVIQYVNTDGEGAAVPHGVIRFMLPPSGTTPIDEVDGTAPAYDDTVTASVDVTLNVHKSVKFAFSQIAQTLDGGRAIGPVTAGRMADLFNAIEADVCSLASTFSTNQGGTGTTDLDMTALDVMRTKLITAKVPAGDPLYAILSHRAHGWPAAANLADFKEYRIRGEEGSAFNPGQGEFGVKPIYYKGVYYIESQNVYFSTYTYNMMFHRDAILLAMKAPIIPTSPGVEAANFKDPESGIEFQILRYWDLSTQADVLKIHSLYGKSLGREDWGGYILS
jgi:hypothetical protein